MQLVLTWPEKKKIFQLGEEHNIENAVSFNLETGEFSPVFLKDAPNMVHFYWDAVAPQILNCSHDYVCIVDSLSVQEGHSCILSNEVEIQLGNFRLEARFDDDYLAVGEELFHELSDTLSTSSHEIIPEVEDLLSYGGHHTQYLQDSKQIINSQGNGEDVLKSLATEYKNFLIWGEQKRNFFESQSTQQLKISSSDNYFDSTREKMKGKTLTECILDEEYLIGKICDELDVLNTSQDEFFEEDKRDILKELAPEHIVTKGNKSIPSLVLQDFYKPGLDTLL